MKKTIIASLAHKPYLFQKAGKRLLTLGLALMITTISFAQQTDDDPGGNPGEPDVPFDGGISILVAAGIAYGAKMKQDAKKKQTAYFNKIMQ